MKKKIRLFHRIAPVYKFFYNKQRKQYRKFITVLKPYLQTECKTVLDIGFGTGALLEVLDENGFEAYGIEAAPNMIAVAQNKLKGKPITLYQGDILKETHFDDDVFDCVMAAYVLHGFDLEERKSFYDEVIRLSKRHVVLYEHSAEPSFLIKIAERLEGGTYFDFIDKAMDELEARFDNVETIRLSRNVTVYMLTVSKDDR